MSTLTWVVTDFETESALDIKKVGAWRYAEDPTTRILCMCYSFMGEPWKPWTPAGPHDDLLELVNNDAVTFISFGDFERAIWRKIMHEDLDFPDLKNDRWHDIQAVAAMKQMPKNVDDLSRALGLAGKDTEGKKVTLALSKVSRKGYFPELTPEVLKTAINYCGQDVVEEVGQHKALGWLPPGERRYWLLNQRVNERGLRIDLDFVRAAQAIVDKASIPLLREFATLTDGLKPGQRDKYMGWMETHGVRLPDMTKQTMKELFSGDDDDEPAPGALPTVKGLELPAPVLRSLTIRNLVASSSLKKLRAMELCVCADGRARGLLQYHGTGPGRSSGRLLQPQNFPKPTIEESIWSKLDPELIVSAMMTKDPDFLAEMCGVSPAQAIPVVVSSLRHAITCNPGRILMSNDYSGIQARLVLAAAGQHDKADILAKGLDIYCDMASQIYKRPINKKDHPKERGVGKNSVLGLGFQMGAGTFQVKYAREHPLSFCSEIVRVYRKEWAPKVPYFWYGLQDAATAAVWSGEPREAFGVEYRIEEIGQNRWLTARLPSGRKIYYYNPRKTRRPAPWDPDEIKAGFSYQAIKQGVMHTIDAFGGQLAENVIMGMEADIMRTAQLKCEANGLPIVLECHDEIVVEPLLADADEKAFTQILLDVDPWVKEIKVPVAVEGWVGERYRK
jgi:DNA polymerase